MYSDDEEEDFPTADLDDPVWSEEPILNSQQHLCIHQIPYHPPRSAAQPPQPNQVEVPSEPEQMDIKIVDDLLGIINVLKELLSYFDSWAHSVLEYINLAGEDH